MKKIMKKVVALAATAAITAAALVGCASGGNVDNTEVVATVGDSEITAGVANFYLRYQQAGMESLYSMYFGDNFWSVDLGEGETYADELKDQVLASLHEFYVLEDHMAEYDVALSDEETAAIEEAAAAFVEDNTSSAIKNVSGDAEYVKELLKLFTINEKMFAALTADVDRDITDDEAAQKRLRYYSAAKSTTVDEETVEMTEEEVAALKEEMTDFLAGAKENGSMEAYGKEVSINTYSLTFDSESASIAEEVVAIADKLQEGEFSGIIETDSYLYVVQLESLFDEEATETKKENIISERESEAYEEVTEVWLEETEMSVNEDVWDKVDVAGLKVTEPATEE